MYQIAPTLMLFFNKVFQDTLYPRHPVMEEERKNGWGKGERGEKGRGGKWTEDMEGKGWGFYPPRF